MKELDPKEKRLLALALIALNREVSTAESRAAIVNLADKMGIIGELDNMADEVIAEYFKKNN